MSIRRLVMKLTQTQLKKIILEEINNIEKTLNESEDPASSLKQAMDSLVPLYQFLRNNNYKKESNELSQIYGALKSQIGKLEQIYKLYHELAPTATAVDTPVMRKRAELGTTIKL